MAEQHGDREQQADGQSAAKDAHRHMKGWIGYGTGPGGKDHLPPDVRAEIERRDAKRREHQGRLLCEVDVQVYEHDVVPGVAFPVGSALDVESDSSDVASAVARARDALAEWR